MRKQLLLSLTLLSGYSFGQSFTAANEPIVGDSRTMYLCDSAALDYANIVGTGVTWDYSEIDTFPDPNGVQRMYTVIDNPNVGTFTNSTKAKDIEGILRTYMSSTTSDRYVDGFEFTDPNFGTVTANFSGDNMHEMTYPFALNAPITDNNAGTLVVPGIVNSASTGNSTSVVDGIGTIKLCCGVIKNNVARHHTTLTLSGTTFLGPVTIVINQFEYYDFVGNNMPLFSHTNVTVSSTLGVLTSLNFVLNSVKPVSGVGVTELANEGFAIYPNPASGKIAIQGEHINGNETVLIKDFSGKTILSTTASSEINIENLAEGMYFVCVEKDGMSLQEKFVKY